MICQNINNVNIHNIKMMLKITEIVGWEEIEERLKMLIFMNMSEVFNTVKTYMFPAC